VSSLIDIAKGWYNYVASTPYTKRLMEYRLDICDKCPKKEQLSEVGMKIVTAINKEGSLYRCGECKCPLAAKTANPKETCPLEKWRIAGTESLY